MSRSDDLLQAVKTFNAVHADWVSDPNSQYPTGEYWRAFDLMAERFKSGEIPEDRRELTAGVFDLLTESEIFNLSEELEPHDGFWAARERLETLVDRIVNPAERKRRETIKQLDREKVPHEQIARIWGLRNADGSGQGWKIQQELDKPGSVITDDFVHPDDVQQEAPMIESRQRWEAIAGTRTEEPPVPADVPQPCPETSEELWRQKVPLAQASKMLCRDPLDVQREWMEFHLAQAPDESPIDDLESAEDRDLRAELKQLGVENRGKRSHEQLVEMVREARAEQQAAAATS